ncbi:ABC transporter ATP-binding protein [Candidatus Woesearchaeota archaeon]|nr:ABC transporter ATP-binding protein [Candidatus Woesearchaeota archaeon]
MKSFTLDGCSSTSTPNTFIEDSPVEKLSRGQQQKIAIARGFLAKPKIILLDEPTTGLDPVSKIDVLRFVKKVMKERDITIIITSHDMDEIEKLCDDLVIMNDGAVIAQGSVKELKQKYSDNNLFELQTTEPEKSKSLLEKMIKVNEIKLEVDEKKNNRLTFKTKRIDSVASEIIGALDNNDIGFIGLVKILPSLEDVFVKLTGKHLE